MEIYISRNGEQEGPYSTEQLQERIRSGTVPGDAFYWHEGCEGWLPVREHPGFAPPPTSAVRPPPPPPAPTPPGANATPATLNHCAVCGRAVAPTAQTCPQCGHKLKRKLGCLPKLAIGAGVFIALWLILGFVLMALSPPERRRLSSESPGGPTEGTKAPTSEGTAMALPASEAALISTVQLYVARYASARNELQKSTVRTERQAALAKLMTGMEVSDWVGTLKDMSTYPDGKASIKIELNGSPITVHTDLGNPFEPGTDTSIAHGSVLYNQLSALSVGDPVRFSGSFLPGERDHLKETSFTESGAMTQPEFVMRFSEVSAASAATSSGLTASPTSRVARAEAPPEDALPPRALVTPSPAPETSPEPLPSAASTPTPNVPPPRSVVSDFFSWYLDAVRRGRSPWLERELSKRPEISHGFAVRLENAKEPEPGNDPIFSTEEVPGAIEITDAKVNAFDATVAVRLGSGNTTRLVNVRLVRSDDSDPWQIDDVQPMPPGNSASSLANDFVEHAMTLRRIAVGKANLGKTNSSDASSTDSALPTHEPTVSERLLIGKWRGSRHTDEYLPDHSWLMDGVNLNPPRTWQLRGDQLTVTDPAGPTKYKVISADQKRLVLSDSAGRTYSLDRLNEPLTGQGPAQKVVERGPDFVQADPYTDGLDRFFAAVKARRYDEACQEMAVELIQNPDTSPERFQEFIRGDATLNNIESGRYLKIENHDAITIVRTLVKTTSGVSASVDFLLRKTAIEPWQIYAVFSDTQFPASAPGLDAESLGLRPRIAIKRALPPPPPDTPLTKTLKRSELWKKLMANMRHDPSAYIQDVMTIKRLIEICGKPGYTLGIGGPGQTWYWKCSDGQFAVNVDVERGCVLSLNSTPILSANVLGYERAGSSVKR